MNKTDEYIEQELLGIKNRFAVVINALKDKKGIIESRILDLVDDINKLSVEI